MSHPTPDAAQRGRARLERELDHSLILPRCAEAFRTILVALDTAQQLMRDPAPDISDPVAASAGILLAVLDAYTAALTELGTDR